MEIYVLRHGQTDYNVQGKFQGHVNTKLNQHGIEQAEKAKEKLKEIQFDIIICSPLNRAIQTAKIVKNEPLIIDNRIIERSFGNLEGKYGIENYQEHIWEYNIEPMDQIFKRIYSFLDEIKQKYQGKEKILVVTHECVAQVIQCYFEGIPKEDMLLKYRLNTGEYKRYYV